MTDKKWQEIITACRVAGDEHLRLLRIAEDEYIRRYKYNPSEVDDDEWIDALHYCNGHSDLSKLKESAELHSN